IDDIDKDAKITLIDETQGRYGDDLMFDICVLDDEEVVAGQDMDKKEITLAKALAELKSAKLPTTTTTAATTITTVSTRPKAKGIIFHEQMQASTSTFSSQQPSQQPSQLNVQDKGKGKMVKPEPVKKLLKKDQLMLDEELAFKLQAKLEEEDRLVRQREEETDCNFTYI
ncbi:hypothetical protein Tco_0334748, partial [Tanacetum coccineum]